MLNDRIYRCENSFSRREVTACNVMKILLQRA